MCAGHGLGHATRVVEVAQHITALCHAVTICSGANVASLLDKEHPNIELRSVALDCGSVQAGHQYFCALHHHLLTCGSHWNEACDDI